MFSDVWSENAALFERLTEIHSNPPMALIEFKLFKFMHTAGHWVTSPSVPSLEIGDALLPMLIPHHEPPISEKRYTPITGIDNHVHWLLQKSKTLLSRDKRPKLLPFPRKWEHSCSPLFEWGL